MTDTLAHYDQLRAVETSAWQQRDEAAHAKARTQLEAFLATIPTTDETITLSDRLGVKRYSFKIACIDGTLYHVGKRRLNRLEAATPD